jgi:succinyl-diaminopimelate desuccinylase
MSVTQREPSAKPSAQATDPTLDLACALIARASVTPEDAGCQDLIAARLAQCGFRAEAITRGGVRNLWLRRGSTGPCFAFAGHTDVVPTGPLEAWTSPPFEPTLRSGRLYGRGAADMKSSLAAFTVALEQFVAAHPDHPGSLALLLTADEEGPATDGTTAVIETLRARNERIDYCIVGEPTCVKQLGDMVKSGRRGSLTGRLTVIGQQGHVAYPHLARNPVHLAAPALAELTHEVWDAGSGDFPPTTLQISNIHAGTGAGNVIPGTCVVDFNLRFCPASPDDVLRQRIHALLDRHGLEYRLDWTLGARPFQSAVGRLLQALGGEIQDRLGQAAERSTTGGTSDARFIATWCPEVVEFGPTNDSIHMIDESLPAADPARLKDVYLGTLRRVLLTPAEG